MENDAQTFLQRLTAIPTPTGFELDGMRLLAGRLREAGVQDVALDLHGNLRATLNPGAPTRVMIEGHCDEIGLMVQYIDDDGFLYMSALGGVTVPTLAAERIVIQGRNGPVSGVFGLRPPHLLTERERERIAPQTLKEIAVDIGARNREEAMALVDLGSPAVIDAGWRPLANQRVACRGFDNRIGAFVVVEAMRRLVRHPPEVAVHLVASVQEEVGLVGGITAAYDIAPMIGFCVDVTHATDANKEERKIAGDVKIGGGPVVNIGPTYHPELARRVLDTAAASGLTIQRQARNRGNCTCAWAMRLARTGAAVAQLSVPLRYMHTPVEVLSLDDAAQTIDLLCDALRALPRDCNFVPSLA